MAVSEALGLEATKAGELFTQTASESIERVCHACDKLVECERELILMGNPTEKQLEELRKAHKWLLRIARLWHWVAADPEYPDQTLKNILEAQILRMEEVWKLCYEPPMPTAEADRILAEAFPG